MANRIIFTGSNPNGRSVKVRWDREWNEYTVQFFLNGEYLHLSDYHTDHKGDAMDTAQFHLNKEYA
jgi:hypothetical protein